ncbi:MAG: hypothetical protein D6694_09065, partial [Gammaproteobacteria bacterium]
GDYQYRVRACNQKDWACGPWSAAGTVTKVRHIPRTPAPTVESVSTTGVATVRWASDAQATRYQVEQYQSSSWQVIGTVNTSSHRVTQLPDGDYRFRVKACNEFDWACSQYGTTDVLKVRHIPAAPTLSGPSIDADGTFDIRWSKPAYADHFELDFDGTVTSLTDTHPQFTGLGDGTYRYRIRACNDIDRCSPWTSSLSVKVLHVPSAPGLPTYPDQTDNGRFVIRWSSATGNEVAYELQEVTEDKSQIVYRGAGTSYERTGANGRYRYRVRACNASGCSNWVENQQAILAYTVERWARKGDLAQVPNAPYHEPVWVTHDSTVGELPLSAGVGGGQASVSIPISVPPGVAGMAPSLALVYSSQSGNGIAGMGFSLSGLGTISRCPQTWTQDGIYRGVQLDEHDRLCLNGQRLMLVSGVYGQPGATYRTELESYVRVTQLNASLGAPDVAFKVEYKSGTIEYYGTTEDSRFVGGGLSIPHSWGVARVEDRAGNFVRYQYADLSTGEHRIVRIDYTGSNTLAPNKSVVFVYEDRKDANGQTDYSELYQNGGQFKQTKRLLAIRTLLNDSPVYEYRLQYGALSQSSGRSLLRAITHCAWNGAGYDCRPSTALEWSDASPTYASPQRYLPEGVVLHDEGGDAVHPTTIQPRGDFDGDGTRDVLVNETDAATLLGRDGKRLADNVELPPGAGASVMTSGMNDIDFDGRSEIVFRDPTTDYVTIAKWSPESQKLILTKTNIKGAVSNIQVADFNRDGRNDILLERQIGSSSDKVYQFDVELYLATPETKDTHVYAPPQTIFSFERDYRYAADWVEIVGAILGQADVWGPFESAVRQLVDFNGDGVIDLFAVTKRRGHIDVHLYEGKITANGVQYVAQPASRTGLPEDLYIGGLKESAERYYRLEDINGDGLPDGVYVRNQQWRLRLNHGGYLGPEITPSGANTAAIVDPRHPDVAEQA